MDEVEDDGAVVRSHIVNDTKVETAAQTRRFLFEKIFDSPNTGNAGKSDFLASTSTNKLGLYFRQVTVTSRFVARSTNRSKLLGCLSTF